MDLLQKKNILGEKPLFPRRQPDCQTGAVFSKMGPGCEGCVANINVHKGDIAFIVSRSNLEVCLCSLASLFQQTSTHSWPATLLHMARQTMMLQLLTGALLLLLPWFGGPTLGEISNNFSMCLQFFYNETPPMGFSAPEYQPICQRYGNQYRFATLYHREHRAPLYSAYILKAKKGLRGRRKNQPRWMYEPQVSRKTVCCVQEQPLS